MNDFERVDVVRLVADAKAAQARAWGRVLESDCPTCSPGSRKFELCHFQGMPQCRLKAASDLAALRRQREQRMEVGKVPSELRRRILLDQLDTSYASVQTARRIMAKKRSLTVLAGPAGNLKSSAAGLVVADCGGLFLLCSALAEYGAETSRLVNHAHVASVLVLDDFGRGRSANRAAIEHVEELICGRWDAGLTTIVTCNLLEEKSDSDPRPGFYDLLGGRAGRVADRLHDPSNSTGWVWCVEESKRKPEYPRGGGDDA
jgi:hypothetical protein